MRTTENLSKCFNGVDSIESFFCYFFETNSGFIVFDF